MIDKNKITTKRLKKNLHFRPIQLANIPFLQAVYASTRIDVQNNSNWTTLQKDIFLQQQFHAQHTHYQSHYKGANFDIVLLKRKSIGRLYIHRKKEEIRLIDIALLPDYQNQSIGNYSGVRSEESVDGRDASNWKPIKCNYFISNNLQPYMGTLKK